MLKATHFNFYGPKVHETLCNRGDENQIQISSPNVIIQVLLFVLYFLRSYTFNGILLYETFRFRRH